MLSRKSGQDLVECVERRTEESRLVVWSSRVVHGHTMHCDGGKVQGKHVALGKGLAVGSMTSIFCMLDLRCLRHLCKDVMYVFS